MQVKALPMIVPTALFLFALAGCASSPQPAQTGPAQTASATNTGCSAPDDYHIGPGDVLGISVWNNKNLDSVATVRPDGMISFPLVNAVQAAGRTPVQLQNALDKALHRYLANPQVSVVVQKTHATEASVLGQVKLPGSYPMRAGTTTVLDMLAKAGGFTDFADKGSISVLRKKSDGTQRIHFRYFKAISKQPGASDFCVQPGDIIMIR